MIERETEMRSGLRFLGMIIVLMTVLPVFLCALAAESGNCGMDVMWTLDEDGVLTISGMGEMDDFEYIPQYNHCRSPWSEYAGSINKVIISEGITGIGYHAFHNCQNLTCIFISGSVVRIGSEAFAGIDDLTDVVYFGGERQWRQIVMENDDREILEHARVHYMESISILPASLERIETEAFFNIRNAVIDIPGTVIFIGDGAFDRSVIVFCEADSYAETRCREMGLKVIAK